MTEHNSLSSQGNASVSRRGFIKIGAAAGTLGAAAWAGSQIAIPDAPAYRSQAAAGPEEIIKTTCALCPSGCGLDVRVVGGQAVKVEGNPLHPLNQGVCCLKGQASLEVLYSPERIQRPWRQKGARGSGDWEEISWDHALGIVSDRLSKLRASGLAHTVGFVHGELRGQMRALVQRFMRAYGSPNVISQLSLGEQAVRQALYLSQGVNGLPVYDLNNANYVMTFGGNLLESSRHVIGYLGSLAFMRRGRPQRGKLVAVHPRLSLTGIKADEWIPIRPGTYGALALGMANVIINSQLYDEDFVRDFTFGFEDFTDAAGIQHKGFKSLVLEAYDLERVSTITGIATEVIARLAGEFATNRPAVAVLPLEEGELASGNSLYTAMAVHALNALVGSLDSPGGVLIQRFPEPQAWPDYIQDPDAAAGLERPRIDGAGTAWPLAVSAYQKTFEAILAEDPYPVEALFLLNANPVYELPDGGRTAEALLKVPFVVSFAPVLDESAAHADLILPASTFLEEWGDDYLEGTGYAGVSLRQPVIDPLHDTRNPGDVLIELAGRLGAPLTDALPWQSYRQLVEYRLESIDLDWEKFIANGSWSEMVYFNAEPGSPAWSEVVGRDRLHAPQDGRFDFFSRELFALFSRPEDEDCLPHFIVPATLSAQSALQADYPFLLVTQSLITQSQAWDGIVPSLQEAYGLQTHVKWSSWVEMNPQAAESMGLHEGEEVWVESPQGRVKLPVRFYEGLWPNAVYIPGGMGHRTLVGWGRGMAVPEVVGVNPAELMTYSTEPLSGQAVYSPARVRITRA